MVEGFRDRSRAAILGGLVRSCNPCVLERFRGEQFRRELEIFSRFLRHFRYLFRPQALPLKGDVVVEHATASIDTAWFVSSTRAAKEHLFTGVVHAISRHPHQHIH
jgi:hypothetical protein